MIGANEMGMFSSSAMGLFGYIFISAVYIMVIRFGLGIHKSFEQYLFISCFVLGGLIGWYFDSYMLGFMMAALFSLIFW